MCLQRNDVLETWLRLYIGSCISFIIVLDKVIVSRYYFLSRMCADFDLCETCERKCEKIHIRSHVFVKIPNPLNPNMLEGKTLLPSKYKTPRPKYL